MLPVMVLLCLQVNNEGGNPASDPQDIGPQPLNVPMSATGC